MAQWQSTGSLSQRYPGFDSRRLTAFFTFLYFCLITSKFIYMQFMLSITKVYYSIYIGYTNLKITQ